MRNDHQFRIPYFRINKCIPPLFPLSSLPSSTAFSFTSLHLSHPLPLLPLLSLPSLFLPSLSLSYPAQSSISPPISPLLIIYFPFSLPSRPLTAPPSASFSSPSHFYFPFPPSPLLSYLLPLKYFYEINRIRKI